MTTSTALHAALRQISSLRSQLWRRRQLAALGLILAAASVLGGSAFAAADTWSGTNSGNWNDGGNWGSGVPTSTSVATFSNSTNTTVTLASAGSAGGISFTGAGTGAFTIGTTSGPAITLASGSTISTDGTVANPEVVNAPLILAGSAAFTSVGAATADSLTIGGSITSSASSGTQALTLGGSGTGTVSGAIGNGTGTGVISVTQTAGSWTLSGANTYAGGTTLTAGTLNINSSTAIGTGTLAIASGATIDNTSGSPVTLTTNNVVSVGAGFTFGGTNNLNMGSSSLVDQGSSSTTIVLNGTNSNLTFGGALTNGQSTSTNYTLLVNGAGNTLTLGGFSNNKSSAGKIWAIGGSANVTVTGAIGNGTAPNGLAVNYGNLDAASGTLTLSGTNTYSAGTTLGGGTLNINSSTALGTGTLSISSSGTATINNTSGSAITLSNNNAQTWNFGFTFIGTNNLNMGTGSITMSNAPTITVSGGILTLGGAISGNASLNKKGAGTLVLSGTNTYNGGMTINANGGMVQFTQTLAMPNTGAVAVGSGAVLAVNAGGTGEWTNATSGNGSIGGLFSGLGGQAGSTVTLSSGSAVGIDTTDAGGSLTYAGNITNSGVGLVKLGTGSLVLSGANTYTGATTVANGNLQVTGSLGASSALTVGNGTSTTAVLSGTGTVSGNVSTTATSGSNVAYLAPGVNGSGSRGDFGSAGTLHIGGNLALGTGTNLDFDLSSSGLSGNDQIAVGGTFSIGTALTFNINELSGSLDTANKYQLVTFTGSAPSLGGVTFTTTGTGSYTAVYSIDGGGEALDVAFSLPSSTPTAAFFNGQGSNLGTFANFDTTVSSGTAVSAALGSTTNVSFNANRNTTVSTATLNTALDVNSVTFGTGSGIHSGMTINGTGTLTVEATTANGNGLGNGITVNTGGGNNAINTAVALDNDQTWTVTDSTSTLTMGGPVSGAHKLSTAGNGAVALTNATGNSYSGGTAVNAGSQLLISNTSGSATGSGTLSVAAGATLGGAGIINASSFSIGGAGSAAKVIVGNGTDTTSQLTLTGSGANTITNTTLQFNISAATAGQGNQLNVGTSAITFSSSTLALNVTGAGIIPAYSPYVLIAGTGVSQYSGLTTQNEVIDGKTFDVITGGLSLSFSPSLANTWYANNSFLYLNTAGGVDDIEVDVVPEPGTWAMMLGGLAVLILWQRRRRLS